MERFTIVRIVVFYRSRHILIAFLLQSKPCRERVMSDSSDVYMSYNVAMSTPMK